MKINYWFFIIWLMLMVEITGCASGPGELTVEEVWARPGLVGGNTAVYFIVTNPTGAADRLLSAKGDVAARIELHLSAMDENEVMKMEMQPDVKIPGKSFVEFKRGGLHLMLIDLNRTLDVGESFKLTLQFEQAGAIQLDVPVEER